VNKDLLWKVGVKTNQQRHPLRGKLRSVGEKPLAGLSATLWGGLKKMGGTVYAM